MVALPIISMPAVHQYISNPAWPSAIHRAPGRGFNRSPPDPLYRAEIPDLWYRIGRGNEEGKMVDIDAYLARIGYAGSRAPTGETLAQLQQAHMLAVPFENLDIALG